jgi:hypothetical protein
MCDVPGEKTNLMTHVMGTGQSAIQTFAPLNNICQHVCGLHCYDGELQRQVIAHHFCSHLNEEVRQCVIYDKPEKDGKLIGVEYIISRRLYEQLPEDEKKYWHSHVYEVKSGMLVAPRLPEMAEHMDMAKLVDTYGKTWHMWQVDRGDPLPYGPANLMMSFTKDGQIDPRLLAEKDKITGVSTDSRKEARKDIPSPTVHPSADKGLKGGPV